MARHILKTIILIVTLSLTFEGAADDSNPAFEVRSGATRLNGAVYFLNAVFEINLPVYIRQALDIGFDLPLATEIEVYRSRSYWVDEKVVTIKQQYRIQNFPLLGQIAIYDVNQGSEKHFDNLDRVIKELTVLLDYPMLDRNNLQPDQQYYARLRIGIDNDELPIPLKSSSLWKNDWELVSDWHQWQVTQ